MPPPLPQAAVERSPRPDTQTTQAPQARRSSHINQAVADEIRKADMFNRIQRCDYARQQLAVNKSKNQIYRQDNNADKHIVADGNRGAELAAAQQRVADECT